ncbi:hypothetical protein [Bosea sp. (in: a-proteobacteria)]
MTAKVLRTVSERLYGNFLLPDRTAVYRELLAAFAERGYVAFTFAAFARARLSNAALPERILLLRHDIDTDPGYLTSWLEVERSFGFASTSYFRLRTLDVAQMRAIAEKGGEAGYHYEELASYAKAYGLRTRDAVLSALPAIRQRFADNLAAVRSLTELPIETVASHGDFANRLLDLANTVIIDRAFAERLGIIAEAYEPMIQEAVSCRISDQHYPKAWRFSRGPSNFESILALDGAVVELLTHPRHWRAAPGSNLREDADRILSSVFFRAGVGLHGYVDLADRRGRLAGEQRPSL